MRIFKWRNKITVSIIRKNLCVAMAVMIAATSFEMPSNASEMQPVEVVTEKGEILGADYGTQIENENSTSNVETNSSIGSDTIGGETKINISEGSGILDGGTGYDMPQDNDIDDSEIRYDIEKTESNFKDTAETEESSELTELETEITESDDEDVCEDMFVYEEGLLGDAVYIDETGALVINTEGSYFEDLSDEEIIGIVNEELLLADADGITVTYNVNYGQTEARSMLSMVNKFRTNKSTAWYWNSSNTSKLYFDNLQEYTYDYDLEKVAMRRAAEIAIRWSHTRPNDKSCFTAYTELNYSYSTCAENIAAGYTSAQAAFTGWCETNMTYGGQGHRRAMLSSNYKCIGIGHVIFNGVHFWSQEFSGNNHNSVADEAINGTQAFSTVVAFSQMENISVSLSKTTATICEGETYVLPSGKYSFSTTGAWPSQVTLSGTLSSLSWSMPSESEQFAELFKNEENQYVVRAKEDGANGKEKNTIKLTAKSDGASRDFTLSINCNHQYEEVSVPATLYSDGYIGSGCAKCSNTLSSVTKRVATVSISKNSSVWNGNDIRPIVTVKDSAGKVISGDNYSVVIKNQDGKDVDDDSEGSVLGCIAPGTYKIIISSKNETGINKYNFEKVLTYTINPKSIASNNVTAQIDNGGAQFVYVGSRISPELILLDTGYVVGTDSSTGEKQYYRLLEGTDYVVEYSANKSVGTAVATIIGIGNYSGTRILKYVIGAATFNADSIKVQAADNETYYTGTQMQSMKGAGLNYSYTGTAIKPIVCISVDLPFEGGGTKEYTLVEGTDYTVSYKNNVNSYIYIDGEANYNAKKTPAITITGKGNFKTAGTYTYTFPIATRDLITCKSAELYLAYSGKVQKPMPVIYGINGKALKSKTEYTIAGYCKIHNEDSNKKAAEINALSYDLENESVLPCEPGKYVIICMGKGNYAESSIAVPFTIAKESEKPLSKMKISLPAVTFPEIVPAQETVKVIDGKVTLQGFYYSPKAGETTDDAIVNAAMTEYSSALAQAMVTAQSGIQEDLDALSQLQSVAYVYYAKNNTQAGTATMCFAAIKDHGYVGNVQKDYKINGTSISKAKIMNFKASMVYDGTRRTQNFDSVEDPSVVCLKYSTKGQVPIVLQYDASDDENTDYTVTYSYPKGENVGVVNVVITGNPQKGYVGTVKKTFKITAKKLDQKEIVKAETEIVIDGQAPFEKLKTVDYTGAVTSPRPVILYVPGGVAGISEGTDISLLENAMTLISQEDYTISYGNNLKRAAASDKKCPTVTIKGKGNYAGTLKLTYNISSEDAEGNIFVSPYGRDPESDKPGDGSLAKPFATLQAALKVASPGSTIYMRGGTYKGSTVIGEYCSGDSQDGNITITNFPGETVNLVGIAKSDEPVIKIVDGAHNVVISGLTIGNYSSVWAFGIQIKSGSNVDSKGISDITIEGNEICKIKTSDVNNCGASGISINGLGMADDGSNAIKNIVIRNNRIHDNVNGRSENISVTGNCNGITITGNTVYKNTNIGIDLYGNNDGYSYCQKAALNHPRNVVISNNVVYSCKCKYSTCAGIYVDGAYGDSYETGIRITGNEVYDNQYGIEIGSEEWRETYGTGADGKGDDGHDYHVRYVTIEGNNIHNNPSGGIRIGGYTTLPETDESGDRMTGWVVNCIIKGNYLTNNGAGESGYNGEIHFSKCDSITVIGNIVVQGKNNKKYPVYDYDWGDSALSFDQKKWATNISIAD